jgi:membrane protease YdiL (CAAX protease family)
MAAWTDRIAATLRRWDAEARVEGEGDGRAIVVVLIATLCLLMLHFVVLDHVVQRELAEALIRLAPGWMGLDPVRHQPLMEGVVWSLGCGFFYVAIPATFVRAIWREPMSAYGFTFRGYLAHLHWYALLFVPVGLMVIAVSLQPSFQDKYPFYREAKGAADLAVWEVAYGAQFIFLEYFFRGFLIHGLKRRLGIYGVFLMITPYMMIHFGKPMLEATGAIVAGTILGFLSLRTGSVFGGATIHILVAISMDLMALFRKGFFG